MTQELTVVERHVQSVVAARADIERYQKSLVEQAEAEILELTRRLESAKVRLAAAESADDPSRRAIEVAERMGLDRQARNHRRHLGWDVRKLRRRVTVLSRDLDRMTRFRDAVCVGHVPMPRLPAIRLDSFFDVVPVEALEAMEVAKESGLFDEFRVINGQDAWDSGAPRPGRRLNVKDPILVGMIGRELFPIAWWR